MTDKQIIIDDLMKQLNEKTVAIMLLRETLDRKEQECEKLEKARRLIETSRDKWEYIAKNKEQECEELNCTITNLENIRDEFSTKLDQLKAQLLDQEAETLKAGGIISKYKQTLTEIKEIAEKLITITDEYDNCYHKSECDKCLLGINGDCQYIKVEQILQKISEVEDEN